MFQCGSVGVKLESDNSWMFSGGPADQAGCERVGWVYGPAGHTGKYLELDVLDTETYRQSYSSL